MLWRAAQWVRTGNANSKGGVRTAVSNKVVKDFPGSPVVETSRSQCKGQDAGGTGSVPGQGTKILHAAHHGKEKKTNQQMRWLN